MNVVTKKRSISAIPTNFFWKKSLPIFSLILASITTILISSCDNAGTTSRPKLTIGIVNPNPGLEKIVDGFKETLTKLCAKKGRQLAFIYPKPLKAKDIDFALDNMKQKDVDLIFAVTTPATLKAKASLKDTGIPIVFAPIYDPVRSGVVEELRNKDDFITGVKIGGSNAKSLEWLLEMAPNTKKILVPFSGKSKVEYFSFSDLKDAATKLGVEIEVANVASEKELVAALNNINDDIDSLWLIHSIFMLPKTKLFVESAIKHKIPFASGTGLLNAGVMIAYGQRHYSTGAQAGRLAHQIFQGVSPKDLPIETADFYLHLDLVTAEKAGVTIPDELIRHAEHVVRNP